MVNIFSTHSPNTATFASHDRLSPSLRVSTESIATFVPLLMR